MPKIDVDTLSTQIKSKYELKNNTLIHQAKTDKSDHIEVEVGDIKQTDFYPQVKLKRWDNEVNFSVRLVTNTTETPQLKFEDDTIVWQQSKQQIKFYALKNTVIHPEGGYEFEITLHEKPTTNVVEFSLQTKGLTFFYQPALTDAQIKRGVKRPENIVGSYAVYYRDCPANIEGGKSYKTGKAFHIYRPRIEDALGNWVWGDLNIDDKKNRLTVTIPQDFLDNATYPVKHAAGLTMGYTSAGTSWGSDFDHNGPWYLQRYNVSTTANFRSVTYYGQGNYTGDQIKIGIFHYTGTVYVYDRVSDPITVDIDAPQWKTTNITPVQVNSGNYFLGYSIKDNVQDGSQTGSVVYWDVGSIYDVAPMGGDFVNPPNNIASADTTVLAAFGEVYSFYATYFDPAHPCWDNSTKASIIRPIDMLTDRFNNNSLDTSLWNNWGGSNVVEQNNRLEISNTAGVSNYYGLESLDRYDLTGKAISIKIVNAGNQAISTWQAVPLQLSFDNSNNLAILVSTGNLIARKNVNNDYSTVASITYDVDIHKYVRIRESSNTVYYEYSTNGAEWIAFGSFTTPYPYSLQTLAVNVEAGNYSVEGSTTTAYFADLNFLTISQANSVKAQITFVTDHTNRVTANIQRYDWVQDTFETKTDKWVKVSGTMTFPNLGGDHNHVLRIQNGANADCEVHRSYTPYAFDPYYGFQSIDFDININGATLVGGDASAFGFDQAGWKFVSLSNYVSQGQTGWQHLSIPMADLVSAGLSTSAVTGFMLFRIWHESALTIEVDNIVFKNAPYANYNQPDLPTITGSHQWKIQAVDTMKWSKDVMRNQKTQAEINNLINADATLGLTHVAISTPYDDASTYAPVVVDGYKTKWITAIRAKNLKVWHRQHWNNWEGDYDFPKLTPTSVPSIALGTASDVLSGADTSSYLYKIYNYILTHASEFAAGDIFTPVAEPEQGGVGAGITNQFDNYVTFAHFCRDAITVANEAFKLIGLNRQVYVGFYGHSGWTALNRLDEQTVDAETWLTIDHYISDASQMSSDLNTLYSYYNVPLMIGEWGETWDADMSTRATVTANIFNSFYRFGDSTKLIGVNYWDDIGGATESLFDASFVLLSHGVVVKNFYNSSYFSVTTITQANSIKAFIESSLVGFKNYEYRVYNGINFVTSWSDEVLSEPSFRTVINGGPGEMVVRLARPFDSFGEDVDVKLNNKVEVYCFDRDAPEGVLIYTGFISGYRPIIDEHSEYIEVTLLHYITDMTYVMLRTNTGSTLLEEHSVDPSKMLRDIIDLYRADGGQISYTANSIDNTNTTVTYDFKTYKVKEAVDKVVELTPIDWYWTVDSQNVIHLKHSDLTNANHNFIIGRHVTKMETWRRIEDVINRVYFVGAETAGVALYRVYSNTASIASYGIHAEKIVDQRVSLTTTADIMANRVISHKKDPEIRTTITIVDNNGVNTNLGYDIESIKPGQTMKIKNIKQGVKTISRWDQMTWDVDVWDQTLSYAAADTIQIQSVEYHPNYVVVEASSRLPEIAKRVEDVYRNLKEVQTLSTPSDPTAG